MDPVYQKFAQMIVSLNIWKGLSHRAWLALHAEVKVLQQQYRLSYKNSTHRLYLAELEKLKLEDKAKKAFSAIRQWIDLIIDYEIVPPMSHVDNRDDSEV